MRRILIAASLAIAAGLFIGAAQTAPSVVVGPYRHTVVSRDGQLIWYVGVLAVEGRRFRELDAICQTVPVPQVSGWRAPTMRELETLTYVRTQRTSIATITQRFPVEGLLAPALPPFIPEARLHPRISLISRDLDTYEGQPTTLAEVRRGRMYIRRWYDRWTQPFISRAQSITHNPGDVLLTADVRLLCVAEH